MVTSGAKFVSVLKAPSVSAKSSSISDLSLAAFIIFSLCSTGALKGNYIGSLRYVETLNTVPLHVEILFQRFQFRVCCVQNSGTLLPLVLKVLPGLQIVIESIFPFLLLIIGHAPGFFQLVDLKQQNYLRKIINFENINVLLT